MSTAVEQGMIGFIALFHSYASKGGDPEKLDKKELKSLLKTEFPSFVEVSVLFITFSVQKLQSLHIT